MSYAGLLINACDIIQKRGEEAMATAKVFFPSTVTLGTNYFLRYNGTEYKIIKILRPQDSAALHHVEVYVV